MAKVFFSLVFVFIWRPIQIEVGFFNTQTFFISPCALVSLLKMCHPMWFRWNKCKQNFTKQTIRNFGIENGQLLFMWNIAKCKRKKCFFLPNSTAFHPSLVLCLSWAFWAGSVWVMYVSVMVHRVHTQILAPKYTNSIVILHKITKKNSFLADRETMWQLWKWINSNKIGWWYSVCFAPCAICLWCA